jgi:hypothetical protein
VLSCVTPSVLLTRVAGPIGADRIAELARNPVVLRSSPRLRFLFFQTYRLDRAADAAGWDVPPTGYRYEFGEQDGPELVAYHWHPEGQSNVVLPHLHARILGSAADLSKLHLPTGPVTPAEVVRCLMAEFGVEPLRADWQSVLAEA